MGIKTGAGGMNIMGRDIEQARGTIGKQAASLAKAKSGGAGIGGLLGAIIGQILIPIPGVGAAIGGAIGGWGGSKIGGMTAGVDQDDIMSTKFFKQSTADIATGIAKQEFGDVIKAGISGYTMSGSIAGGLEAFKLGATGAKAAGQSGFMGGIKGLGEHFVPKLGTEATTKEMAKEVLAGDSYNILDVVKSEGAGSSASSFAGSAAEGGLDKVTGGIYRGVDKFLGGVLPGGQDIGEGYIGKGLGKLKGLLGSQTGQDDYLRQIEYQADVGRAQLREHFGGGENLGKEGNPFGSSDALLNFQKMYNEKMGGPTMSISEDGRWGPESEGAYEMWMNQ